MGFVEYIMEEITEQWCVDLDQIHMTGISNGGMFTYYIASNALDGLGNILKNLFYCSHNPSHWPLYPDVLNIKIKKNS